MGVSCSYQEIEGGGKKLRMILWIALLINLAMFVVEMTAGFLAHSNALLADSLDMLGDVFVYAVSLFVLGKSHIAKANASLSKGVIMGALGIFVLYEAVDKILNPVLPTGHIISSIALLALIANGICFYLMWKFREKDLNLRSAWVCSRNDTTGNLLVIVAGLLVIYFNSMWPDILVGILLAIIILWSSFKIVLESQEEKKSHL